MEPDIKIYFSEWGGDLPPAVVRQVFETLALMAQDPTPPAPDTTDYQLRNARDIGAAFEESTIVIGHSPDDEQEYIEYYTSETARPLWPNIYNPDGTPGRPVAHWRSGISTGCDQEAFLMADGHLEWTEP